MPRLEKLTNYVKIGETCNYVKIAETWNYVKIAEAIQRRIERTRRAEAALDHVLGSCDVQLSSYDVLSIGDG